ncbi:MAG: class I SAM-dependent methyltransferase [Armatimonadota bacterium]
MTAAADERWLEAQRAEAAYWRYARGSQDEFFRITHEKAAAAGFLREHAGDALSSLEDGRAFEVGIGPMGFGVISLLPWASDWTLVGVDPLALVRPELPPLAMATWRAAWELDYAHVQGVGENAPLASASCDLAVCYNVLAHVSSPAAVLAELHRVLKQGGYVLVGEGVRSCAGVLKMKCYTRLAHRGSILVDAHPHDFTGPQLETIVRDAGFRIIAADRPHEALLARLLGRCQEQLLVGRK